MSACVQILDIDEMVLYRAKVEFRIGLGCEGRKCKYFRRNGIEEVKANATTFPFL